MNNELTLDLLKTVLRYDRDTGQFIWLVETGTARIGQVAGSVSRKGYLQIGFANRSYAAHRLAWLYEFGSAPSLVIDHINGDKRDNRIANLRNVSQRANIENQRKPSGKNKTSGLLGVWKTSGTRKFVSRITANGKRHHLGYFDTAQEGHEAYVSAKRRLHEGCTL